MIILFVGFLFIRAELAVASNTDILLLLVGASISAFAAFNLITPRERLLSRTVEHIAAPLTGALGGLLGGLTGIWGPPMIMLFVKLKLEKDDWAQAVSLVWFVGSVLLTYAYWQNGMLNSETTSMSLSACLPGMLGIWVGEMIRRRINQKTFRKVMLLALFVIGINLIRRAIFLSEGAPYS